MYSHLPMTISFNTRVSLSRMRFDNGYGYATENIWNSLKRMNYDVRNNDTQTNVGFWFDQPHHWVDRPQWHNIGYHPWESTEMKPEWVRKMKKFDEIWTPSPVIAQWYKDLGIPEVFVYEHGVDKKWTLQERKVTDKIRFLHVGGEALRKGADLTLEAFRAAFQGVDDVELTMKRANDGWNIKKIGKVTVETEMLPEADLIKMFHNHHVFVYPSWGEGFGLNPLQAMATGMPTICTGAWAPYERLLDPDLTIDSELAESPWQHVHPGKMFKPNKDDLVDKLRWVYNNFEDCAEDAVPRAHAVHQEYDWDTLTARAFAALEWRLFSQGKIAKINGL